MIENFIIGLTASILVSVALWLFLPRGVAITRSKPARDGLGEAIPDSWVLQNQSPLPVQILRVRFTGFSTIVGEHPVRKLLTPSDLADEPGGPASSNDAPPRSKASLD